MPTGIEARQPELQIQYITYIIYGVDGNNLIPDEPLILVN